MHWTRLREKEHSSWHNRSSLNILSHICRSLNWQSSTLISFRDLHFLKSPNAISTWLSMVWHEFYFCHATFQSAPWRPAVEPWTEIWSWGSSSWCKNTRIHSLYMYTHLCFQKSSVCVLHAKYQNPFYTMKNITLFRAMDGLISSEWMRRTCLWWLGNDRKLLSATVSIPSFCESTATIADQQWTDHSGLLCPAVFQKSSWCSISDSSVLIYSFPPMF